MAYFAASYLKFAVTGLHITNWKEHLACKAAVGYQCGIDKKYNKRCENTLLLLLQLQLLP